MSVGAEREAMAFLSRHSRELTGELREARDAIVGLGRSYGLDFYDIQFIMCSYDEINMLASYGGFPVRYPHWRWGMDYLEMSKGYEYGLQKIYEMVINTDPAHAYLLDNNLVVDQKLVMAHVLGHVDFFKNNLWFRYTNRKMVDQMANHAARVRRYIDRHGADEVEIWIDVCLSLDNLVDLHGQFVRRVPEAEAPPQEEPGRLPAKAYMDRYVNPPAVLEAARKEQEAQQRRQEERSPSHPVRDVLGFLVDHATLPPWKQDVLHIVREEALYFGPQAQTKIMNEGWAVFWHSSLMTRHILTAAEVVDYADHHSGTVAMRPGQLNPYKVGVELFKDIEMRWDRGQFGPEWQGCDDPLRRRSWDTGAMVGRKKVFEVRKTHNDVTFIDEFLTEDFVKRVGLFTYEFDKRRGEYVIASDDFADVKRKLLFMLSNRGQPRVQVVDANHANRGELVLQHLHEGVDVHVDTAGRTLENLHKVWGRPVHLETVVDGKQVVFTHDGTQLKREARAA